MTETNVVQEKPKKPRGAAAHRPGCQCRFCLRKGGPKPDKVVAEVLKDPEEVKLDHFQYSGDEHALDQWENDATLSPIDVPRDIKDRYPGLAFRYISSHTLKTRGAGYNGWELFRDKLYPEGVLRGNDLRLGARPKGMSEAYQRRVQEASNTAIQDTVSGRIAKMEQAIADSGGEASFISTGETVKTGTGPARSIAGTVIGARPRVGRGGGYQRGALLAKLQDQVRRGVDEAAKNKKTFDLGGRK